MGENYRIYLSSTYKDLLDCRQAVYAALQKVARVGKVVAMEDYVAVDQRPLDKVLKDVEACDIYVGLFAWRYGFVPSADNPDGKSITELEFRRAKSAGKHCLIFVLDQDAPWKRSFQDDVTGENDRGKKIGALRAELLDAFLASSFSDAQQLAGLVATAVGNYIAAQHPPAADPRAGGEPAPHFRELRNAFYLAHSPVDEAVAKSLALTLGTGLDAPVRLSSEALFAAAPAELAALDQAITRCHAAVVLLTASSLGQLTPRTAEVATVLDVLRARTGATSALLVDVAGSALPASWGFDTVFEASSAGAGQAPPAAALAPAKQWIDGVMPPFGTRTVGVPVCVLTMNTTDSGRARELPQFRDEPARQAGGGPVPAPQGGAGGRRDLLEGTLRGDPRGMAALLARGPLGGLHPPATHQGAEPARPAEAEAPEPESPVVPLRRLSGTDGRPAPGVSQRGSDGARHGRRRDLALPSGPARGAAELAVFQQRPGRDGDDLAVRSRVRAARASARARDAPEARGRVRPLRCGLRPAVRAGRGRRASAQALAPREPARDRDTAAGAAARPQCHA